MSATTTQLLSSGEFCKLRYDTIPVKSATANVSFYTNNSKKKKAKFLSCDTLVANEPYRNTYHIAAVPLKKKPLPWTERGLNNHLSLKKKNYLIRDVDILYRQLLRKSLTHTQTLMHSRAYIIF